MDLTFDEPQPNMSEVSDDWPAGDAGPEVPPEGVGEAIFDLLSHLAVNPATVIDDDLLDSFAQRHGLSPEEMVVETVDGPWTILDIFELIDEAPADAVEGISALFAHGLAVRLGPLADPDRRRLMGRVVALLPGIERLGPLSPTAHFTTVLDPHDLEIFWAAYTERLLVELNKRAAPSGVDPWLSSRLVRMPRARVDGAHGAAWSQLIGYVARLLQHGDVGAIHQLVEGCRDEETLAFVSRSPRLLEAPDLICRWAVEGGEGALGCAIATLHVFPTAGATADQVAEALCARPFEQIAPRLLDIVGQLHRLSPIRGALARLQGALLTRLVEGLLTAGDPTPLVQAVPSDARAFAQSTAFLTLDDALGAHHPQLTGPLLQQVLSVFYQSFTPSGLKHEYNDARWQAASAKAMARLIRAQPEDTLTRIARLGLSLDQQAARWIQEDVEDAEQARQARARQRALACGFLGRFAETVGAAARRLYQSDGAKRQGLAAYGVLVRVFQAHRELAMGSGLFGAMEFIWSDRPTPPPGVTPSPEEIEADAKALAELEARLWPPVDEVPSEIHVKPRITAGYGGAPDALVEAHRAMPWRGGATRLEASALVRGRPGGWWRTIWGLYSGWDLMTELLAGCGRLLGIRREGWVTLEPDRLHIAQHTRWGSKIVKSRTHVIALSALEGVRAERQLRWPYAAMAILTLAACAFVGGHSLFLGLRTGLWWLAGVGAGLMALGVIADLGWMRLFSRHRGHITVALRARSKPHWTRVMLRSSEAEPILEALELSHLKPLD